MKVAILVFSPSGNTLKAAKMLETKLIGKGIEVQTVDATRRDIYPDRNKAAVFLQNEVKEHDVLLVGGPVYAHHMHYNVLSLIGALPRPGEGWGALAIPFVTYGAISSGVALYEAGRHLKRTGRKVVMGMKAEAFHCMSKLLATKINEGKPGEEIAGLIDEMAERIAALDVGNPQSVKDITSRLNYQKAACILKANIIFREKLWQKRFYPKLDLIPEECSGCGECAKACPVQRLAVGANGRIAEINGAQCIHCGECIAACRNGVIGFKADLEKWNEMFREASEGHGPMPSNEKPRSAVIC